MPVTLADLRALMEKALTHTENPAILRLPEKERTVEGLDHAHQPRILSFVRPNGFREKPDWMNGNSAWQIGGEGWTLRPADPGTAHALLVALTLGMGLDPGVGGLDCSWCRDAGEGYARWLLRCALVPEPGADRVLFDTQREADDDSLIGVRVVAAPEVANESDPIRALELAVRHVLEGR